MEARTFFLIWKLLKYQLILLRAEGTGREKLVIVSRLFGV